MRNFLIFLINIFWAINSFANIYTVTDTTSSSSSTLSLRYAMTQANLHLGRDTIQFNITGVSPHEINLDSLPDVTDSLFINGLSQPGADSLDLWGLPIVLDGLAGLTMRSAGCNITGLKIA